MLKCTELMVIAAVRHGLPRATLITNECIHWLVENWENLSPWARDIIRRDIEAEFADGYLTSNLSHTGRLEWERVRQLWREK